jgi:hypothetical protein
MTNFVFRISLFILLATPALAQTEIQFTNKELSAAFVLVRPELNTLEVNGRTGVYTPSPALRFFGLGDQQFEIESSTLIQLADIEFNHVKSKTPEISFDSGVFTVKLPVEDQVRAIQSRLGSISTVGIALTANLSWQARADGSQELVLASTSMQGVIRGTGALAPNFVLNQVRSLIMKTLTRQIRTILAKQDLQDAIQKGLLAWSKFYTGTEYHSVTPGSVNFFRTATDSGLQFQVQ